MNSSLTKKNKTVPVTRITINSYITSVFKKPYSTLTYPTKHICRRVITLDPGKKGYLSSLNYGLRTQATSPLLLFFSSSLPSSLLPAFLPFFLP